MNYTRIFAAPFVVALLFTSGCSESITAPTSPLRTPTSSSLTADQLLGTWTLLSIQPTGENEQRTPAGAAYTLTFGNGSVSTRADCNLCSGTFAVSGQTLTIGPALACTRAACPTMAFENTYTTLLSGETNATLSAGTLTLSSPRGVLRLTR